MKLFVNNAVVFSISSVIKILITVWQHSPQCRTLCGMSPSSYHDDLHQQGIRKAERAAVERGTPHSLYLSCSLALSLSLSRERGARERESHYHTSSQSECEDEKIGRKNNIFCPRQDITNSSLKTSVHPQKTGRMQKSIFALISMIS